MGEILLDWEGHDKALSSKLWEFFKEEYLVDFSVTCHGQQKKVHKFVLAFLFPMLKESLRSTNPLILDHGEADINETVGTSMLPTPLCLNLDNIVDHAEDMDYLIQFAYTGKVTVPKMHAACLLHIAETMEIKSLKKSLGKWNTKSKPNERNEPNDKVTTVNKLRPRTQLKKIISESVDIQVVSSDDDIDLNSTEDSCMSNSLDSMVSSDDDDNEEIVSRPRKRTIQQNKVSQKRPSEGDGLKNYSRQRENSIETHPKVAKTDSDKEACEGVPLQSSFETTTISIHAKMKDNNRKCHQCDFVARYPSRLQRHLETHLKKPEKVPKIPKGPKKFICKTCNEDLGSQSMLSKHRATNCGTELFTCKYCGHKTRRKVMLKQHIIGVHQVDAEGNPLEKNVKCPDCDYVCYAKHQLQCHLRAKHKRLNMFKCKECNYAAPYISELVRHERQKHLNIRNFKCEECGYRFQTSERLNHHVLVRHKGVKLYKCDVCDKEYSDSLSFKIHMQRHEGKVEYKFVCHICGHNFRKGVRFRMHMEKIHGKEQEEQEENETEPNQQQEECELTST